MNDHTVSFFRDFSIVFGITAKARRSEIAKTEE